MEFRKKQILFRCCHRGTKELDELLGKYAKENLDCISDKMLFDIEALLDESDGELYNWITGNEPVPKRYRGILNEIRTFHGVL